MCGLAGFGGAVDLTETDVRRMCDALVHRGPDDSGVHLEPGTVGLGFRRLSIIDLETGHQPLRSETGDVVVTCNGEVYNFRTLREQLVARGHRFASGSDTEVIAHLWEERGEDALHELQGMFAIALWDRGARTLMLARDRMGVKPLYWAPVDGGLVYGSEPSAILASGLVTARPDHEALLDCLVLQYVQAPRTGFVGMHKLGPGECLLLRDGDIRVRRWWQVEHPQEEVGVEAEEAIERVDSLLEDATRSRLIADVPLGAFLSGGVDSSLVVAYMAQAQSTVRTFSMDFPVAQFSEGVHARRVSEIYGTQHEEFLVEPEMVPLVAEAVRHVGEPYADSSAIPTYLLSQMTRREVTVALSGDGGDEAFGGYTRYRVAGGFDRAPAVPPRAGQVLDGVLRATVGHRIPRVARVAEALAVRPEQRYARLMSHFTPRALAQMLTPAFAASLKDLEAPWSLLEPGPMPAPNRYCAVDIETYLPGDLLTKVDRMSMSHSLEVRSPLLDYRVQEYAARLPASLKIKDGQTKWLLKRVAARRGLPHDLVHRQKRGFGIPIGAWFRGELRSWVREVLGDPRTHARGYFRPEVVDRLVDDHLSGRQDHAPRIWNLLMLEYWHREYIDR